MRRGKWIVAGFVALLIGGGVAVADDTTGTNVSCATTPAQTVQVNGSDVYTVPEQTACNTVTYTIPTSTQTVTTPGETVTSPPVTVTQTVTQTVAQTTTTGTTGTTTTPPPTGCLASPGSCGFPDPNYVGSNGWGPGGSGVGPQVAGSPVPCSSLTPSGSVTASTGGETVSNLNITGTLTVTAANVTVDNVCITASGSGTGSFAVKTGSNPGVNLNTLIENSTITGATPGSLESALFGQATLSHDDIYGMGDPIEYDAQPITDTYLNGNGSYSGAHYEDVYANNQVVQLNHDTLLNPHGQTATVFGDTSLGSGGPCRNQFTITNSFLAGGGFPIYECGNASSVGSASLTVTGDTFGRCSTTATYNSGSGGTTCTGGADSNGYFPLGGYYGLIAWSYCSASTTNWSGNVWDGNGANVPC